MPGIENKNDLVLGMVIMGVTGVLMGVVVHSGWLSLGAGGLGVVIGGFVGWIGGRRYLIIILVGVLIGAFLGSLSGDRDILIIASGSGGAIAGFVGAQIEMYLRR